MKNKQIIAVAALLVGDIGNVNAGVEERERILSFSLGTFQILCVYVCVCARESGLMITIKY